jgi:hypothetical protein
VSRLLGISGISPIHQADSRRLLRGPTGADPLAPLLHGNPDCDDGQDEGDNGESESLQVLAFSS